jgi:hypothetical protein
LPNPLLLLHPSISSSTAPFCPQIFLWALLFEQFTLVSKEEEDEGHQLIPFFEGDEGHQLILSSSSFTNSLGQLSRVFNPYFSQFSYRKSFLSSLSAHSLPKKMAKSRGHHPQNGCRLQHLLLTLFLGWHFASGQLTRMERCDPKKFTKKPHPAVNTSYLYCNTDGSLAKRDCPLGKRFNGDMLECEPAPGYIEMHQHSPGKDGIESGGGGGIEGNDDAVEAKKGGDEENSSSSSQSPSRAAEEDATSILQMPQYQAPGQARIFYKIYITVYSFR